VAGGEGLRSVAAATGTDRKTVRRYVEAAVAQGLQREGGRALDDDLLAEVVGDVLPGAPPRVGEMRALCRQHACEWRLTAASPDATP
jgi:hypothetical protein